MHLAELTLAGRLVGFGERGLDVLRRLDAPDRSESTDAGEQSRELLQPGAASLAHGDRFLRDRQGVCMIAEGRDAPPPSPRGRRLRLSKADVPLDRQRHSQDFERIVP